MAGLLLGGCMQSTLEPAPEANLTPRDRKLLANAPYAQASIPEPYQRHIVDYHRKEAPGTDRGRYRRALSLLRAAEQARRSATA